MEQLLRGQEISEIDAFEAENPMSGRKKAEDPETETEAVICPGTEYDLSFGILYFPIRHHSPVCSFHLQRAVEEYQPDCILIEGPQNAGHLIPVLVHEDTQPPLALYYAYRDKEGLVSPKKEDYKCYYPFLSCSPELIALREADRKRVHAEFIDLPYMEILAGTAENRGIRREGEKQSYNDDYFLSRSRYFARLCEKTGLRDFEEFWETYFEIQGLFLDTPSFVRQMLLYCGLSRLYTPEEELLEDGGLGDISENSGGDGRLPHLRPGEASGESERRRKGDLLYRGASPPAAGRSGASGGLSHGLFHGGCGRPERLRQRHAVSGLLPSDLETAGGGAFSPGGL